MQIYNNTLIAECSSYDFKESPIHASHVYSIGLYGKTWLGFTKSEQ